MTLRFTKMHGAANDFVVIDHRVPFLPAEPAALFARLCDRRRGIGADGVLLLERDPEHDFAMRYHNADGGRAEFCGNGARCIARFALELGLGTGGRVTFRTDAGVKRAEVRGPRPAGRIALWFGPVEEGAPCTLAVVGRTFVGRRVVAGVPHLVVPVEHLTRIPFDDWAPALRSHPELGAGGANVDFVERFPGGIGMRTFERGVEGETLACGSGAIATAMWGVVEGAADNPVTVRTSGGDDLVVELTRVHDRREAVLVGPTASVFTGAWQLEGN